MIVLNYEKFKKSLTNESLASNDIYNLINKGGYIKASRITNDAEHKISDRLYIYDFDESTKVISARNEQGDIIYTLPEFIISTRISENVLFMDLENDLKRQQERGEDYGDNNEMEDPAFNELLQKQGSVKNIVKMIKKHHDTDYSRVLKQKNPKMALYDALKQDGLI